MTELLPTLTSYGPDHTVGIEVRGFTSQGSLSVWHLGDLVAEHPVAGAGVCDLGGLPTGGYSVELRTDRILASTAVEVVDDPRSVLRYGFVADYRPGRDLTAVQDNLRRLHLTGVQFYDWAYRHADLLGGGEDYRDALGQPVSLDTVRRLVAACHEVGSDALGYAAVYAVGRQEWPRWGHDALLTASGAPYALGDFLFLVDPAATDWLAHLCADLRAATGQVGFDGFHLDQYGYPKRAYRRDGALVDVADSFCAMIAGVRTALPDGRLVFNNVNDFPIWATAGAPQDALYVEVWPPHVGYEHLVQVVTRARREAAGRPVVVAAYQQVYDSAKAPAADLAAALTMATLFSHGAWHLLCGEADRVLVDPYYVRNHQVGAATADLLRRWYDFAVAHAELLFPAAVAEVTGSLVGADNDDVEVSYPRAEVEHLARPGTVWRRVTEVRGGGDAHREGGAPHRYVVHLVNLTGQPDTRWDAPRNPPGDPGRGRLRIRRTGARLPRVRFADPDRQHRLLEVEVSVDGDHAFAALPAPRVWQVVVIETEPSPRGNPVNPLLITPALTVPSRLWFALRGLPTAAPHR